MIANNSATWFAEEWHTGSDNIDLGYQVGWDALLDLGVPQEELDQYMDNWEGGDLLIGFVECDRGDLEAWFDTGRHAYKPDLEAEYSAIVGQLYTQVVRSEWVLPCRWCSPCFPSQGDLDSPVSVNDLNDIGFGQGPFSYLQQAPALAYCLPPGLFDPEYDDKELINGIRNIQLQVDQVMEVLNGRQADA